MQEEPKPTPKPKKKRISKRVLLIILGVLLIAASVAVILYFTVIKDNREVVDCNNVVEKASKNLSEGKYPEGIGELKKYQAPCMDSNFSNFKLTGQPLSNEKRVVYSDLLVQFLYKSGDKVAAKKLANETISNAEKVRSNLNNISTDEFVRLDEALKRAYMLKADKYYEVPQGLGSRQ